MIGRAGMVLYIGHASKLLFMNSHLKDISIMNSFFSLHFFSISMNDAVEVVSVVGWKIHKYMWKSAHIKWWFSVTDYFPSFVLDHHFMILLCAFSVFFVLVIHNWVFFLSLHLFLHRARSHGAVDVNSICLIMKMM